MRRQGDVVKKHSSIKIDEKLARAEALEKRGVAQKDICKQLGISVMTLHRWRKRSSASTGIAQILREENDRLRNIAIDILLHIQAIEEANAELPRRRPQTAAADLIALMTPRNAGASADRVEDMPAL